MRRVDIESGTERPGARLSVAGVSSSPVVDAFEVAAEAVFRERGHVSGVTRPEGDGSKFALSPEPLAERSQ